MARRKEQPEIPADELQLRIAPVDEKHMRAILKTVTNATRLNPFIDGIWLEWITFDELPGPITMIWRNVKPGERNREQARGYILGILARKLARRKVEFLN